MLLSELYSVPSHRLLLAVQQTSADDNLARAETDAQLSSITDVQDPHS
jgi:hypothetical protein